MMMMLITMMMMVMLITMMIRYCDQQFIKAAQQEFAAAADLTNEQVSSLNFNFDSDFAFSFYWAGPFHILPLFHGMEHKTLRMTKIAKICPKKSTMIDWPTNLGQLKMLCVGKSNKQKSNNCSLTQLITKHGVIIECHRTWQTKYLLNKSALIFWKRELWGQRHIYASFEGKIKNFSRN